jgi:CIC family chloride channel protein
METERFRMFKKLINKLLYWRIKHVSNRTLLIIASVFIGAISAIAAVSLKLFVHWLHSVSEYFLSFSGNPLWYIFLPFAGIILTVIVVKYFFKGHLEKGLGSILYAVARKSAKVEKSKMYSQLVTSGITIGLGGSAGLEAPIVITGSAIGSNIASFFNFGYKERALLLACGAAAGIAAVFNSPIAGVIFAIEVLLLDISIPAFIPLLISTATSIIISKLLYKGQLFYFASNDWYYHAIPFYIILGVVCGLVSVYMTRITLFMEGFFHKFKKVLPKAILGGLTLGLMIFLLPPLFGEGYSTVNTLLSGDNSAIMSNSIVESLRSNPWAIIIFTFVIIIVKIFATSLTIGAGGNGGIFAPSLFTGALTGFGIAFMVNTMGLSELNISNFVVVGMAGILSGVVHAPLTAIFLIAEITGGYMLFVPLMIVSALSYFISKYFEPYSVYTKMLAKKGQHYANDKDRNILNLLNMEEIIEKDFVVLNISDDIEKLIAAFTKSNRSLFPVVDHDNNFCGLVYLDEVKEYMLKKELYPDLKMKDIVHKDIITIDLIEDMDEAMAIFENQKLWNIPVLDGTKYIGFISRSNIFSHYRRTLKNTSTLF